MKNSRVTAVFLAVSLLMGLFMLPSAAQQAGVLQINLEAEAESGLLSADTTTPALGNASGGKAVSFGGARHDNELETIDPDLTFTVNIEKGDAYALWGKFWTTNAGNDSVYYAFDDTNYIQVDPKNTDDFEWILIGSDYLEAGTHTINFKRREAGCLLDQVRLSTVDSLYTDAPAEVGQGVYPQAIDAASLGSVAPFEKGDRVAFIGDSITHGGYYVTQIFNYYATRYPDSHFTLINKGIGGDDAGEIFARMEHDVYDADFNKAVLLVGCNDMNRREYFAGSELLPGADERRARLMERYKANIKKIYDSLASHSEIEQIIFMSPSLFDEWVAESNNETSPGFNNVLRKAGAFLYDFAQEQGIDYIDVNTPALIIDKYNKQRNPDFTVLPDRMHPKGPAAYMMTYAILKAQGETGEVAAVEADAAAGTISARNAAVTDAVLTGDTVSFTYSPNALPIAADQDYRDAEKLFPISAELNREIIRVGGLSNGMYTIKMDGTAVATVSADDLAAGVNIADKKGNPSQLQSLSIKAIADVRQKTEANYREFMVLEANTILPSTEYQIDRTSNETMLSSAQAYVAANESNASKAAQVAEVQKYIKLKQAEPVTLARIAQLEEIIYEINRPGTYQVTIEPVSGQAASDTNPPLTYLSYAFPTDAVRILPFMHAEGVGAERILFTDEAGTELAATPAAGSTIFVKTTLFNHTTRTETAAFWAAIHENGCVKAVDTAEVILAPGERREGTILRLTVPAGQNLSMAAGVWDNFSSIRPLVHTANFLSTEVDLSQILVDGASLDGFSPDVTEYQQYISPNMTRPPTITATAKNNYAAVSVSDFALPGTADITVTGAGGAEKTYHISFVNPPEPRLAGLRVNGETIDGFTSGKASYEYEYTKGSPIPHIEADAADPGLSVSVSQASALPGTATVTVTAPFGKTFVYTISFVPTGEPGVISDVSMNGSATNQAYGVPSVGAPLVSYYDEQKTPEQMLEAARAADNPYVNDAYMLYTNENRSIEADGGWATARNKYYGYNIQFMYADDGASMFINPKVTRLVKPDTDRDAGAASDAAKNYEFTISKGATVYITTSGASPYIEKNGWTHVSGGKYQIYSPAYKDIGSTTQSGYKYRIPTGATAYCETARGDAYYKHYSAGDRVAIPAFHDTAKCYRNTSVFIIWDECNREADLFGIHVNGNPIESFDKNTTAYAYTLPSGTTEPPVVTAEATAGANVVLSQAAELPGSAAIEATLSDGSRKTYTIAFTVAETKAELTSLSYAFAGTDTPIALTEGTDGEQATKYEVVLPRGFSSLPAQELPKLSASAPSGASLSISDIEQFPGTATVTVTAGAAERSYQVRFRCEHGEINNITQKLSDKTYLAKHDLQPLSLYELRDVVAREGNGWQDYCKLYIDRPDQTLTVGESPSLSRLPSEKVSPQLSGTDQENPQYGGDPRFLTSYNNYWDKNNKKWTVYWFNMWLARGTQQGDPSPIFNGASWVLCSNNDGKSAAAKELIADDAITFEITQDATVYVAAQTNYPAYEAEGSGWTKDTTKLQVLQADAVHSHIYSKHFSAGETVKLPAPSVEGNLKNYGGRMMVPLIVWDGAGNGDTSLSSLQVGGVEAQRLSDTEYTAAWTPGAAVTATAADSAASVYIQQATSANDTAKIYVMSKNECRIYTVSFTQ